MPFGPHGDNVVVHRSVAALVLAALLATACGSDIFKAPRPTAGDFTDVVGALVRRGMTVTTQVAGDAGCSDSTLHNNAVRYDVRPAGDTTSYPVFILGWKSQATFDADKPTFDACTAAYSSSTGRPVETAEHLPWRAFGPDWPPALRDAVGSALTEAGGIPAPVQPE
jgi:hypothetical protein